MASGPRRATFSALFGLGFPPAPGLPSLGLAAHRDSQAYSTKDTPQAPVPAASWRSMVSGSLSLPSPGFFSPFPHGTCSLSVAGSYSALDRGRPGFRQGSSCPALLRHRARKSAAFRLRGYHALRPRFPARSAMRRFSRNFPGHPRAALQPRSRRFGLLPVRSPLLGESLLISVPVLLRWFTSHSVALPACLLRPPSARLTARGLPHSEIRGSMDVCSSPRPIAACRVLHRRPAPPGIRHGPMIAWPYPCSRP